MPLTLICCIFSFFVPTESLSTRLSSSEEQAITACRIAIHKAEGSYRIPPRLLESIALIESGRSTGAATSYPWPWTVTVNGKGHYFPTRSEAIAAVRRFQARGARNIDVGCMQINLFHHPKAFKSLQEAFDITQNVSYAAKFLKELQEQYASWSKAVGCYHSATPHLHGAYRHRVLKKWAEVRRYSAEPSSITRQPNVVLASLPAYQPRSSSAKMTKLAKPVKATSLFAQRTMDQAPHRAEKPMSAFYASLNRRTSGKIYQANLCRGHIFPRHSYLLKVGS